jgi:hypothetical protein
MLYSEIIALCSQIHTKHVNTLCVQNVDFLMLNWWHYVLDDQEIDSRPDWPTMSIFRR